MSEHLEAVKKYDPNCDEQIVGKIIKHLGIALRSKDASLVSCSSKDELARVRDSWCKKKLAMTDADAEIDKKIKEVCETMKADRQKNRVAFYYLLAKNCNKMDALA